MAASSRLSKLIRSLIAGFLVVALLSVASAQSVAPRAVQVDAVTESVMGRAPIVTMAVENVTRPGEAPLVGESLRASATTSDPDGDAITATSYRWLRGGTEIASTNTYTVVDADRGLTLSIEAIATTDSAITDPASGTGSTTIAITANTAPTATPTITGTLQAGQTLTANAGYADADNDPPGTHAYQWYRSDVAGGSPRTQIAGATAATYVSVATDLDKYLVVGVVPVSTVAPTTGVEAFGVTSAAIAGSAPVAANVAITGQTWPNGQARFGWVQTGSYNFTDAENDPDQSTLQWYRADDAAGTGKTRIDSATAATYTPTFADDGKYLFFEVTPISPNAPTTGTAMSAVRKVDSRPVASAVAISGTVAIGQVLTGAHAFNDADNDTEDGTLLKWYRASDASGSDKAAIAGAASSTYTVQAADSGKVLFFEVTPGTHAGQVRGQAVLSAGTVQIVNTPPEAYGLAISGQTWANGQAKFGWAQTGSYSYRDADNDAQSGSTPAWYLADDAAGTNEALIASATGWSYTPTAADDGKFLVFKVTPRAATGVVDGTTVSVARKIDSRPVADGLTVTGTLLIGETLTAAYTFRDDDNDDENGTRFQWYRADDAAGAGKTQIAGATAATYATTLLDGAKYLIVEVTPGTFGGAPLGVAGPVASASSGPVGAAPTATPTITGTLQAGQTLTANAGYADADNDPPGTHTYQWYRSDVAGGSPRTQIAGATAATYVSVATDLDKYLVVGVVPVSTVAPTTGVEAFGVTSAAIAGSAPVAANVAITGQTWPNGQARFGWVQTGSYNFTDAENDPDQSTLQWYRADNAAGTGKTRIDSATAATYTPTFADDGKYLFFEVTPISPNAPTTGTAMSAVRKVDSRPVASAVAISGTVAIGQVLTGAHAFNDADNDTEDGTLLKWYRASDASGSDKAAIAGAASSTYTVQAADSGKVLFFEVTPGTHAGQVRGQAVLSAGTVQIVNTAPEAYNLAISGQTWPNGQAKFGWAQTGSYSYRDADNDAQSGSTPAWYLADDAAGTNETLIVAATGWSYTPTVADDGKFLVFKVTPRAATGVVDGTTVSVARKIDSRPVVTGVDYTGTQSVGQTLTVSSYGFTDADNDAQEGTIVTWFRADGADGVGRTQAGTGTTYVVQSADAAKYIIVEVTPGTHGGNVLGVPQSNWGKQVQEPPPTANPSISGPILLGETLTGNVGYAHPGNAPQGTHSYQWFRADNAAGTSNKTAIANATNATYVPTEAVVGKTLVFQVTPRTSSGTAGQAASVVSSRWVFKHYGNNNWTDNEYFSGSVDKTFTVSGRSGNAHTKSYVTWDISFGGYRQFYRLDLVAPDGTLYNLMPFGTSGPSFMQGAVDLDLSSEALNGTWRLRVSNNLPTGNGTIDFHQVSVFF